MYVRTLTNKIIRQQKRLSENKAQKNFKTYKKNPILFFQKYSSVKDNAIIKMYYRILKR